MKAAVATLVLLSVALPAWAQRIQKPPVRSRTAITNADDDETEVDLATLAADIGAYDHKRVRTRGVIELIAAPGAATRGAGSAPRRDSPVPDSLEYYELRSRHTNATLLFIPGYGLLRDELKQVLGSELQVRGVIRMLRAQGESIADAQSPELPPLPMQSPDLPRVSITVLTLSMSNKPRESVDGQNFAKQVLAEPSKFLGKPIRILGQFRGNNLFGDLPEDTRRKPADWVLKDGENAVWVTERPPKGKGFTLDPAYKGDTSRWVEVEGKPEVVNGVLYLRATQVFLAQRRTPQEP